MTPVYILILIISENSGTAALTTQEFNSEATCKIAAEQCEIYMSNTWKDYKAICVQK